MPFPQDEKLTETYTLVYRGTSFGLIKTSEATIEADLQIVDTATVNNTHYAPNFYVGLVNHLRTIWKGSDININGKSVSPITNADRIVAWIRHLTTGVHKNWSYSKLIHLGEHDTTGAFDSIIYVNTATTIITYAGSQDLFSNIGLCNRTRLFNGGVQVRVIATLDMVCFNENGTDKYIPLDFDIQITLHRNPGNKYIRKYVGNTAAGGANSADVAITNFLLNYGCVNQTINFRQQSKRHFLHNTLYRNATVTKRITNNLRIQYIYWC